MRTRRVLRLPSPIPSERTKRSRGGVSGPVNVTGDRNRQTSRFRSQFAILNKLLSSESDPVEIRSDPGGISPERALVFILASPIDNFVAAARKIGLEVIAEDSLDEEYALPEDLMLDHPENSAPTLYATMPTVESLRAILGQWKNFQRYRTETGSAVWRDIFMHLADLRTWNHLDRVTPLERANIKFLIEQSQSATVQLILEIWPTKSAETRVGWREKIESIVLEKGGKIVDKSAISETGFIYEAMLVELAAGEVLEMLKNTSDGDTLANFDGLQFILPQTQAQVLPKHSESMAIEERFESTPNEAKRNIAAILDGVPATSHAALRGCVTVDDIHNLVQLSEADNREHATEMASLILRGDLCADNTLIEGINLHCVPVLIDREGGAFSPEDRLFVDVLHQALRSIFESSESTPLEVYVVNFSIGTPGEVYCGQISSLARLLDWWAYNKGVLFVVSTGNVKPGLELPGMTLSEFEDMSVEQRVQVVRREQKRQVVKRKLLSPSEAINVLTVGAVSGDVAEDFTEGNGTIRIEEELGSVPAVWSACGLGHRKAIKPDLLHTGGYQNVRTRSGGDRLMLIPSVSTIQNGLYAASVKKGLEKMIRTRGTSSATALTTRAIIQAAEALQELGGAFDGVDLTRRDLALLTRALAVNASYWPDTAERFYSEEMKISGAKFVAATEETARYFGHGILHADRMIVSPEHGATLVGLGAVASDEAAVFRIPLPVELANQRVGRDFRVTIAWFSPADPVQGQYRLAAFNAVSEGLEEDEGLDKGWRLDMKGDRPALAVLERGTVWSRRLKANSEIVPNYGESEVLPIKVQCRDTTRGSLPKNEKIHFAIAATLEMENSIYADVYDEIQKVLHVTVQ